MSFTYSSYSEDVLLQQQNSYTDYQQKTLHYYEHLNSLFLWMSITIACLYIIIFILDHIKDNHRYDGLYDRLQRLEEDFRATCLTSPAQMAKGSYIV